jgi:hypothetical protein
MQIKIKVGVSLLCGSRQATVDNPPVSVPEPVPNMGMELTAYIVRSFLAPASGSSSGLALD